MTQYAKTCLRCRKPYKTTHKPQMFCSRSCRTRSCNELRSKQDITPEAKEKAKEIERLIQLVEEKTGKSFIKSRAGVIDNLLSRQGYTVFRFGFIKEIHGEPKEIKFGRGCCEFIKENS
jgi:hypothetical protein